MSLDKWIKPEKKKEKKKEEEKTSKSPVKAPSKKEKVVKIDNKPPVKTLAIKKEKVVKKADSQPKKFSKFILTCPKAKCKYQKKIMKKQLADKDKICPRCKSMMKVTHG